MAVVSKEGGKQSGSFPPVSSSVWKVVLSA